jgi:hypothetical protein
MNGQSCGQPFLMNGCPFDCPLVKLSSLRFNQSYKD